MKENTTLTAYCFLAALTETKSDLYQGVFIPVVKRALSHYNLSGKEFGHDTDIQDILLQTYGLNVPVVIIRQLLKAVETSFSRKERENIGLTIMENGKSFKIEKFTFLELEENYKKGERNARGIQKAFERFVKDDKIEDIKIPTFAEFLQTNRNKLTAFFRGEAIINGESFDSTFIPHIEFLETIEKSHNTFYKIAENIYLGSIIASLFECELDLDAKFANDEIYYLDTQVILKALDLQSPIDTQPIRELIELIVQSGAKIKILDITAGEISYILETAINNYHATSPTTTVNEACIRRGKNKAWLIGFNGKLEKNLFTELGVKIEPIPTISKEKFLKTPDIKDLKVSRKKQANAEHDVMAYLHIREKRGGSIKTHQKAKFWFLSANKNLLNFNIQKSSVGNVPEVTLPDTTTAMLWLKNPNKNSSEIKSVGLHELIASTLTEEIASKELINEFDINLRNIENIDIEDYQVLLSSVAYQSAKYIEKLNSYIIDGKKEEFNQETHKLIEKERQRRSKTIETIKYSREKYEENVDLRQALNELESEFSETITQAKTEIENLATKVVRQERYIRKFAIWLIITLLIIICFFLINFKYKLNTSLNNILTIILGLSGFWSFGSFIINLLKALKIIK